MDSPDKKLKIEIDQVKVIIFDFDGVFTDNKVYFSQDGNESVCCSRSDGLAIKLLRNYIRQHNLPIDLFILYTEKNPVVQARAQKLSLDYFFGVNDKLKLVKDKYHLSSDSEACGFIFLGNDINDLALLRFVEVGICPSDAHPLVKSYAKVIYPNKGGEDFVRNFVEDLLGIQNLPLHQLLTLLDH